MALLLDRLIGATSQWLGGVDANTSIARPVQWARKTSGYAAVNGILGMAIPFARRNGFSVEELRPGYVRAKIPLKGNKNHFNSLYAGAYFLLAEIPGGVLTLFDLGPAYVPILKEMTVKFLHAANSDVIVEFQLDQETLAAIRSKADSTGRAAFTLEGLMYDDRGELVATSLAHYRVRKKGFQGAQAPGAHPQTRVPD